MIARYRGLVTCVCLMGEGRNLAELETAIRRIKAAGMKTCLYSGHDRITPFRGFLTLLDYIKLGPYCEALGSLDNPTTNQRFYRNDNGR